MFQHTPRLILNIKNIPKIVKPNRTPSDKNQFSFSSVYWDGDSSRKITFPLRFKKSSKLGGTKLVGKGGR